MKPAFLLRVLPRRLGALLPTLFVATFACHAPAQPVQLRPAQLLNAGGAPLAPGSYAIPCVVDWNGDGRKDLIVGYQTAGKLALFLNSGSDASPVFTTYVNVQAGGADIVHTSSGCGAPGPFVCDHDADGKRDLLVGAGQDGSVYFYRNLGTDASPILTTGVQLKAAGATLTVTLRATPCVCDWDGDGLKDLLCGNGDGYVFFFKNIGTAQAPAYAAGTRLKAAGTDLNLGIRSVVRVFDWDGDGVKDLVGSSDSGVGWCRNVGSDTSPILQAALSLRAPLSGSGLRPISIGPRMRLDLVDWKNDGVIDLLVGNSTGRVTYYEGYRFAFTPTTPSPSGQLVLQWNSAPYLNYQVLAGTSVNSITNVLAVSLPSSGASTRYTNSPTADSQFYRLQISQ